MYYSDIPLLTPNSLLTQQIYDCKPPDDWEKWNKNNGWLYYFTIGYAVNKIKIFSVFNQFEIS